MNREKKITMRDVADALGVHQTTVSLALRNHPSIPEKTRSAIKDKCQTMGYVPDPMLSSLVAYRRLTRVSRTRPTIGYITDVGDRREMDRIQPRMLFFEGARQRAEELGYKMEIFYYGSGNYTSRSLDRILRTRSINGLIVAAFVYQNTDLTLSWDSYSVIKIEMLPFNLHFDVVENNQMQATRLAMEKMHEKGYRRVGMLVARHDEVHTRNLFSAGYRVGQDFFPPEDQVPPMVIDGRNLENELGDIISWLQRYKVEIMITNWNELKPYMKHINESLRKQVLFVSLDLDHYDKKAMGVVQNHEMVGRYAMDRLTGQLVNNERGMVACQTIHLVDSLWREPACPVASLEGEESACPEGELC